MKIWWQSSRSFEDPRVASVRSVLLEYLNSLKGSEVEITVGDVDQSSLRVGYDTVGVLNYAVPGGMLNKIIRAEEKGYDGTVIGCYNDPALHEAREMCGFPVYGVFETSVHVACMLGDKFSGIALEEKQAKLSDRKVGEYGLKEKALPFAKVDAGLEELSLAQDWPGPIIEKFSQAARILAAQGAEVIIPACGLLNLLMAREKIRQIDNVLILDGYAVVLKFAEAMIKLYREIGLTMSRKLSYAMPPKEHLDEILSTYMFR